MLTLNELAKVARVSKKTLRHYDKIGLLVPPKISESGYRLYNEKFLEHLRQILFYKSLNFSLSKIKTIIDLSDIDKKESLKIQRKLLLLERDKLNDLIKIINKALKGDDFMSFAEYTNTINQARETAVEIYEKAALYHRDTNPEFHKMSEKTAGELKNLKSNEKIEKVVEKYYGGDATKYAKQIQKELDPEFKREVLNKEKELLKEISQHKKEGAESKIVQSKIKEYITYSAEITGMTNEGCLLYLKEFYQNITSDDNTNHKETLNTLRNLYGNSWDPEFLAEAINCYAISPK